MQIVLPPILLDISIKNIINHAIYFANEKLMVKIGMDTRAPMDKTGTKFAMRGDADYLRADVDYALEMLGTDYIDIIVLCRVPSDLSIQDSVLGMKAIVQAGKARHIGLSEASAATIRAAHAVHPIYCIEQEWSLWARDIEADIVPTCRELGVKVVAYCPLGRGFLTGSIRSRDAPALDPVDYRLKASPPLLPHILLTAVFMFLVF
jgi:aryl-alcohol dehydrogenase-like predicted oxidoreductase